MRRIMLTVAYDGTNYNGFAYQVGIKSVEGILNNAIYGLTGEKVAVIGASRTDAGVHAYGNIAVFDTESKIPDTKFTPALNRLLPDDIKIMNSREVNVAFHPRHCSSKKTYEYRIWNGDIIPPTNRFYYYPCSYKLDVQKMEEAAQYLVGEHDFTSFCNVESQALTKIRTIYEIEVIRENNTVTIKVVGGGFLYNMVRIIAGTLLLVGRGKKTPEEVREMLEACDRKKAGPTAPPQGLFLIGYDFLEPELLSCIDTSED
ncbi:tRNA pseudouridine(38-40) synthase TruA [Butyrivibrio sp. NC3005]|uniref:tRNA pseudouridine(38-40) synthase TruA n=1 Tax=Butyrivibrio sp. NC3005 TaxID=1280685 RepID=UPI0005637B04|nr:tRNA pseudouridine(38-40) synthase TruA [Butyrivibrio sp. NC3005]